MDIKMAFQELLKESGSSFINTISKVMAHKITKTELEMLKKMENDKDEEAFSGSEYGMLCLYGTTNDKIDAIDTHFLQTKEKCKELEETMEWLEQHLNPQHEGQYIYCKIDKLM
jgi:hypothetical protein